MEMTRTRSAFSARARTSGLAAASSPDTIRSPIGSGLGDSASSEQDHASQTPRPFAVSGM
jgi:hypothetical protein